MSHIVGFGSDGAKVMMIGCHNGVNSRLKRSCVCYTCVAHRLALASADAADQVNYLFGVYRTTVQSPHNYIDHSSVRKEELVLWQETGEEPVLTMKRPFGTRWLSFHECICSLGRTYSSVVGNHTRVCMTKGTLVAFHEWNIPRYGTFSLQICCHHLLLVGCSG